MDAKTRCKLAPLCLIPGALAVAGCDEPADESQDATSVGEELRVVRALPSCSEKPWVAVVDLSESTAGPSVARAAVNAVAVGGLGNAWVAGEVSVDARFNDVRIPPLGGRDAFVGRVDACGNVAFAATYGGEGDSVALDVAASLDGGAYVLGTFEGPAEFGFGTLVGEGPGRDGFLLKLDADGEMVWWKHIETREGGAYATDIDVAANGDLLLLGHLEGIVDLGDTSIESGTVTGFVAKINALGGTEWTTLLGTRADWEPLDLEATTDGGAFVAGNDARGLGVFAVEVTPEGRLAWSTIFRDTAQTEEALTDLTISEEGYAVISGHGFLGKDVSTTESPDNFLAKLGTGGKPMWTRFSEDLQTHLATDRNGDILGARTVCRFGTEPGAPVRCSVDFTKFTTDGEQVATAPTFEGHGTITALDVGAKGSTLLAGEITGPLAIDRARRRADPGDLYVARLAR